MTRFNVSRREFLKQSASVLGGGVAGRPFVQALGGTPLLARPAVASSNSEPLSGAEVGLARAAGEAKPSEGLKLRGLLVDAGRVPESVDYYKRVIEFSADWGLNALQFRIADDQGTALQFPSYPELVTHRNSLTPAEMKSLVVYGQQHGVDLIPELESFGHTGYITRSPKYAHLLDRNPQGLHSFTGVIPVDPQTLEIFEGLYREVTSIFSSPYLHGGCDEVNWGGSALSRQALETKTRIGIWAEYLNSLNGISKRLGKQFIVWGDFVLHKEPAILGLLNKSIIVMDWVYWENNPVAIQESLHKIIDNGSQAIGAPGLIWSRWGPRAGVEQLRNIDAFADAYLSVKDPRCLGLILTNWIPSRYIQDSIWDGYGYGAVAFTQGSAVAQTSAFRRFVGKHYGSEWNSHWDEVFQVLYDAAPYRQGSVPPSWMGLTLPVPWSSDDELTELLKQGTPRHVPFTEIRSRLVLCEPFVRKNLTDFRAFALSVDYLERLFWRNAIVVEQAGKKPATQETAAALIQSIAEGDRALLRRLDNAWNRGRPPNSAAKLEPVFDLRPEDQLLFQFRRAASYSASLAERPDHFSQLLSG